MPYRLVSQSTLTLILLLFVSGVGYAQNSYWLHPLGTSEGWRSNPVETNEQEIDDIVLKWRNERLKNSPVLLVGALRTEDGSNKQQLIGLDTTSQVITLLKSTGFLDTTFSLPSEDTLSNILLTGLFDSTQTSPVPTRFSSVRPNLIGVGLEQKQTSEEFFTNGLFLNHSGEVVFELGIRASDERATLANFSKENNKVLTILPVALWKTASDRLVGFSLITQDRFTGGELGDMINSLRRYELNETRAPGLGQPNDIAPKPYPSPVVFAQEAGKSFLALSTALYPSVTPPVERGQSPITSSNVSYGLGFDVSSPTNVQLPFVSQDSSQSALSLSNQFARLGNQLFRVSAEQGIADPQIHLNDMSTGMVTESLVDENNDDVRGWHIVITDLDGNLQDGSDARLPKNSGVEIIATALPEDPTSSEERTLYLLRRNESAGKPFGQTSNFHYFAQQEITGVVMAAGDIVNDAENRKELILVDQNILSILQLKPYTTHANDILNGSPLKTLKSFALAENEEIISVVIADLEGDGENDIIISTTDATYAIGTLQPNPYTFSEGSISSKVCVDDFISIGWEHNTPGSGSGDSVYVEGDSGSFHIATNQLLNDSLHIQPSSLPRLGPGRYRVLVADAMYPWIFQASDSFTVAIPTLGDITFEVPNDRTLSPGDILRDTLLFCCINVGELVFEQKRSSNAEWEQIAAPVPFGDSLAIISTVIPCPDIIACGELANGAELLYRLRTLSEDPDTTISNGITVSLPLVNSISVERIESDQKELRSVLWTVSDFTCSNLELAIGNKEGNTWQSLGTVATSAGQFDFEVPGELVDTARLCIRCAEGGELCVWFCLVQDRS